MSAAVQLISRREGPETDLGFLFESAPMAFLQCTSDGYVSGINSALEKMLGVATKAEPLRLLDMIHSAGRESVSRVLADLFSGKCDSIQAEVETTNIGLARWIFWRVCGANGRSNSILATVEAAPPIAGQTTSQSARLESIGRLTGSVVHDFNNLLTGVLLYCDLLMASVEPGHRARKYSAEIRQAAVQATGLVSQLLAIARPASSRLAPVSVNQVVEGMRELLTRLMGENIELKFRLACNTGLVKLDSTQVQQIVLNLVLNSRDAMPGGGQILVETRNCKLDVLNETFPGMSDKISIPCALVMIQDNGSGMDSATKSRMFQPFFTTRENGGNGVGLATVHDLVTSNGGLIHVNSELGRGTRVSILLPCFPTPLPSPEVLGALSRSSFSAVPDSKVFSFKEEE